MRTFLAAVVAGELTSVELVRWYLSRIESKDDSGPALHAVVTINPQALDEAAQRDAFFASTGSLIGPLHGVPVLVKDQAESAGIRTTFGSELFATYVPVRDATLIAKLRDSGAVLLAKTSMCDFAAGWFSSSSITDHTKNPYSLEHEAGGSSAGTAAGVAANFGHGGNRRGHGGVRSGPSLFQQPFWTPSHHGADQQNGILSPGALSGHAWSNWADSFRCRFSVGRRCGVRSG